MEPVKGYVATIPLVFTGSSLSKPGLVWPVTFPNRVTVTHKHRLHSYYWTRVDWVGNENESRVRWAKKMADFLGILCLLSDQYGLSWPAKNTVGVNNRG